MREGTVIELDWDGPCRAKIIKINGDIACLGRVGTDYQGENYIEISLTELQTSPEVRTVFEGKQFNKLSVVKALNSVVESIEFETILSGQGYAGAEGDDTSEPLLFYVEVEDSEGFP